MTALGTWLLPSKNRIKLRPHHLAPKGSECHETEKHYITIIFPFWKNSILRLKLFKKMHGKRNDSRDEALKPVSSRGVALSCHIHEPCIGFQMVALNVMWQSPNSQHVSVQGPEEVKTVLSRILNGICHFHSPSLLSVQ